MLVDGRELLGAEVEALRSGHVVLDLLDAAGADEGGRDPGVAEYPGQRQLCQALSAIGGDLVQGLDSR